MKASVNVLESCGLVDGPGIRYVVFFNGCKLRCKYCHNPEMWKKLDDNIDTDELFNKIVSCKPYFGKDGGVTFSGGEPLLHSDFIIELCKKLKKENIHIALDTAGVGLGNYSKILEYIDLIIFDIKALDKDKYKELTGFEIDESLKFLETAKNMNKKFWIRQVIVPDFNDSKEYINELISFVKRIPNVLKVEFLPYHKLGTEKYENLNIDNPYKDKPAMDKDECNKLYELFMKGFVDSEK